MKSKIFILKIVLIIFLSIIIINTPTISHAGLFDDVCSAGDNFINRGENGAGEVNGLAETNANIFNILSTIGMFLSLAMGGILGIKFMIASAEEKAKIKESMKPYILGCIIVFGAFTIWKLVVITLGEI